MNKILKEIFYEGLENLIKLINNKIFQLKNKNLLSKDDLEYLIKFNKEIISPLTDKNFFDKNFILEEKEQEKLYNILLEVLNKLNNIKL